MTTSTIMLPTLFWQLLVDAWLEARCRIDDHRISNDEFHLLEGRLEALCELAERTFGLPVGNVAALIGEVRTARCVQCGGLGRVDADRLRWVHREGDLHPFDLVGDFPADSPLLRLLGVALLDADDLWEAWECGFRW